MSTELDSAIAVRTENDAVIELGRAAAVPEIFETGKPEIAVFRTADDIRIVDLDAETYAQRAERPRRKEGLTVVRDVASFAQYYGKHADEQSEVYVDLDTGVITAVLDAHEPDEPRWGKHLLELRLTPTEAWKRWTGLDRRFLSQRDFAEFLEDNLPDIANEPVPAAEMLEIATTFQAKTRVNYSSGIVQASGDIRLRYEETTDASGGVKGDMTVPKRFAIGVAPFDDVDPYKVEARLRHRIEGGSLRLAYLLDRPEDVVRDAVKSVVAQVEEAAGVKVMRGAPA